VDKARLLIVDDELAVHQLVSRILQPGGYLLWHAPNGIEALRIAGETPPDLVVTDVNMPVMDGWTFVKQLRSSAPLALVPVIFLTSQTGSDDYIRGFRLGADDYLDKVTNFWDLGNRVVRALARKRELAEPTAAGTPSEGPGLQGTLDQFGLASLLNMLGFNGRSGILRIWRSRPQMEEALIYLVKGRVHRVDMTVRKELRNREAIYDLLGWSEGSFEFRADPLRTGDQIEMPTAHLLLEGARRIDEARPRA
jgi:CheY-like chemotaxis protein